MSGERLRDFVRESNRIEGIVREPTDDEVTAHNLFLSYRRLQVGSVCSFVRQVAGAELRDKLGMDVRVDSHFPPPGSPDIRGALERLLEKIHRRALTPHEAHVVYEQLHPFMDGNGRSGRVVWAWMMQRNGSDPFALLFLHRFYYQTLNGERKER